MDIELAQALEENVELKDQLTKAKELLNEFLDFESSCMERGIYISDKIRAETKQFLIEPNDRFEVTKKGKEYLSSH